MAGQQRYLVTVAEITVASADSSAPAERFTLPVLTREVEAPDPWCAITRWAEEITEEEGS
ncbi:MAG: hypothetical protein ACRDRJ_00745 [Streptosporangiaceae bacterium]